MATYAELYTLGLDASLLQRMTVAVAVAAEAIRTEDPNVVVDHMARAAWARRALVNPYDMARQILIVALAQNKAATVAQISAVSDATLQTACDGAIALLT